MAAPPPGGTLLIATWGMPAQWQNTTYELDGRSAEFCTTLPLLLERFGGADVALLVLDSLVDEYTREGRESACYRCYDQLRSLVREAGSAASYGELREGVRRFVERYAACLVGEEAARGVRAVVAPAVGSPGGGWVFEGRAADFEAVALYELGLLCASRPYRRVVLDLSHGVNFMPALALRLAERLAGVLLTAHAELLGSGVELLVYNSDPVGSRPMRINQIAGARIRSVPVLHELPRRLLRRRGYVGDERVEKVNRSYAEAALLAVSALYYPLPLALCYSREKASRSFEVLEQAFQLWLEHAAVEGRRVRRGLSLSPDGVYALLLSGSAAKRLESIGASYPADLEKLRELAELYRAVNESYYHLIASELGRVEEKLAEKGYPRHAPLHEVLGDPRGRGKPDKRVMIAHAGLQKELVEVVERHKLKYIDDPELLISDADLLVPTTD